MTPADALWIRVQRRALLLEPDVAKAILRAFELWRQTVSTAEVERLVAAGDVDAIINQILAEPVLDAALTQARAEMQDVTRTGVTYFARDIPGAVVGRQVLVGFNVLSPYVVQAIRELDTKIMQTLKDDVRETVRAFIENGLRDGVGPRTVARQLRTVIGLAPNQEAAVRNFEALLKAGDREALTRALRDRRFDATLKRALGTKGTGLTPEQIDKMVAAYRKRMISFNAETNARTATLDAFKLGQQLAYQDAVDKGLVDGRRLMKRWHGVLDDRERPEHVAMEGETVPWDSTYSTGEFTPGSSTFNCRCVSQFTIAR